MNPLEFTSIEAVPDAADSTVARNSEKRPPEEKKDLEAVGDGTSEDGARVLRSGPKNAHEKKNGSKGVIARSSRKGAGVPKESPVKTSIATKATPETTEINLTELDAERYVTARVQPIDQDTVAAYSERMGEGDVFPPVELFRDEGGLLWVGDGIHRIAAAQKNGFKTIKAAVHDGGQVAALVFAAGANESNGLRRTNEDKRNAVRMLLADPAYKEKSARDLAELARVSHTFINNCRGGNVSTDPSDGEVTKPKKGGRLPARGRDKQQLKRGLSALKKAKRAWPASAPTSTVRDFLAAWLKELDEQDALAAKADADEKPPAVVKKKGKTNGAPTEPTTTTVPS